MDNKFLETASFAVIGHGSWASALVKILLDAGSHVNWYIRNEDIIEHIRLHGNNQKYLSTIHYTSPNLSLYGDINRAVKNSGIILLATPSAYLEDFMEENQQPLDGKFVISAIKGIIPNEYLTVAEWVKKKYNIQSDCIGIISGPCHAEEVALERLSYLTMVCENIERAKILAKRFSADYIRLSTSTDVYGIEYATVLKNIYAIACGMCNMMGYGDNFTAVIIANAIKEIKNFLNISHPCECRNMADSVYLGDLLVTCYSQFSRNRTFGQMIGHGYSVKNARIEMHMVAEGYFAAACIRKIKERCKLKIDMPIADMMYGILYENRNPRQSVRLLIEKLV